MWTPWTPWTPYSTSNLAGIRVPDDHGRLDSITWRTGGATGPVLLSNDYTLDSRGRRTASAREDGLGWSYGYNDRGEVTSGTRGARSFGYTYDEIGNRITATTTGVEQDGAQTIAYTANTLNQYEAITNPDPGRRTVRGQLDAQAALSASSSAPPPPATTEAPAAGTTKTFATTTEAATTNGPAWRAVTITSCQAFYAKRIEPKHHWLVVTWAPSSNSLKMRSLGSATTTRMPSPEALPTGSGFRRLRNVPILSFFTRLRFQVEKLGGACVFSGLVKSACRVLITLALVLSIGLHWAVLQSAAWVGMIVSYSHEGTISQALEKTFDGEHPCPLCHLVQEGSSQEKQSAPEKQSAVKKLDLALERVVTFFMPASPPIAEWDDERAIAVARTTEPVKPPPRAHVS